MVSDIDIIAENAIAVRKTKAIHEEAKRALVAAIDRMREVASAEHAAHVDYQRACRALHLAVAGEPGLLRPEVPTLGAWREAVGSAKPAEQGE